MKIIFKKKYIKKKKKEIKKKKKKRRKKKKKGVFFLYTLLIIFFMCFFLKKKKHWGKIFVWGKGEKKEEFIFCKKEKASYEAFSNVHVIMSNRQYANALLCVIHYT